MPTRTRARPEWTACGRGSRGAAVEDGGPDDPPPVARPPRRGGAGARGGKLPERGRVPAPSRPVDRESAVGLPAVRPPAGLVREHPRSLLGRSPGPLPLLPGAHLTALRRGRAPHRGVL